MFDACKEADLPKLKQIVQGKPTSLLDTSGNFGATPLHVACLYVLSTSYIVKPI